MHSHWTPILVAALLAAPAAAWAAPLDAQTPLDPRANAPTTVLVTLVPADVGASPGPDASRDAWRAHWDAAAGPALDALRAFARAHGGTVESEWPALPGAALVLPESAVPVLALQPFVRQVAADDPEAVQAAAADEAHEDEGPVLAGDDAPGENLPDMGVARFWAAGYRGAGERVAIIDTGVDPNHEMLLDPVTCAPRVVAWADFVNGAPAPYDDHWHGTAGAGFAVGTTECGGRFAGLAPHADIVAAKVLSSTGAGSFQDVVDGLQFVFDNDADVALLALGSSCTAQGRMLADMVDSLAEAGMVSSVATGSSTIGCPADAPKGITVAAVDRDKVPASFNAIGPCSDGRTCPEIMAVGVDVTTPRPGDQYAPGSGRSWAAAQVAGAAALVFDAMRDVQERDPAPAGPGAHDETEVEQLLKRHAEDLGTPGPDNTTGWGFLQMGGVLDDIGGVSPPHVFLTLEALADTVRAGESAEVAATARHAGGEPAVSATFVLTLNGGEVHRDEGLVLAPGESAAVTFTWPALDLGPGAHAVTASVTYAWEDPETGEPLTGAVARAVDFDVLIADVDLAVILPDATVLGIPFDASVTAVNTGTDVAVSPYVDVYVPQGYVPLPREGAVPGTAPWSDPAPHEWHVDEEGAHLRYSLPHLPPGAEWTVEYTLLPSTPGVFTHAADGTFASGRLAGFTSHGDATQRVVVPA